MWCKQSLCAVVCVLAALGCTSSGDDDDSAAAGTGGAVAASGGAGGAPAMMGSGGMTGAAGMGSGGAAAVMCGGMACMTSPLGAVLMAGPCCAPSGVCSSKANAATECKEPYVNTSMCADTAVMGFKVTGCCLEGTNNCGIWNSITNSGCTDPAMGMLAALIPKPTKHCDGTAVEAMGGTGGTGSGGMGAGTGGMGTGGMGTGGMGTGGMGTGGMGTGGMGTGGMNP
jgi:hypothetical protein